jgi:hypothetical protein
VTIRWAVLAGVSRNVSVMLRDVPEACVLTGGYDSEPDTWK